MFRKLKKDAGRKQFLQLMVILVSLFVIAGEVIYLAGRFRPVLAENQETQQTVQPAPQARQADAVAAYNMEENTAAEVLNTYEKYVFVGDSRYVGMSFMAQEQDVFICKNNMGYDYLIEQMDNIRRACDENTALIIGLGVNDINYSSDNYIKKINEMARQMNCRIYYMLVNPVDEEKETLYGYSVKNEKIDLFNQKMINGLDSSVGIIDTNSYLKSTGYLTVDGLHYATETYRAVYDYIKLNL